MVTSFVADKSRPTKRLALLCLQVHTLESSKYPCYSTTNEVEVYALLRTIQVPSSTHFVWCWNHSTSAMEDQFTAFREFFEAFNGNCFKHLVLSDYLSPNETLIPMRTQIAFLQYNPNNRPNMVSYSSPSMMPDSPIPTPLLFMLANQTTVQEEERLIHKAKISVSGLWHALL